MSFAVKDPNPACLTCMTGIEPKTRVMRVPWGKVQWKKLDKIRSPKCEKEGTQNSFKELLSLLSFVDAVTLGL